METNSKSGSLTCVGTGILIGAHMTPRSRVYIENADIVFVAAATQTMASWISTLNKDVRNLQEFYQEGISRIDTYNSMVEVIIKEVRNGHNVCLALYGHPGVFALVGHKAIAILSSENIEAKMEPGISAEDCLVADLGIDPGKSGCFQYEATQFLLYQKAVEPSSYLILWQIGIVGDLSFKKRTTNKNALKLLIKKLTEYYSETHEVILYEAQTIPNGPYRIEKISLIELSNSKLEDFTTLVIPPDRKAEINGEMKALLDAIG